MDQQQQRQLIEAAIDSHAQPMFRVAYRWCGNRQLAEEIVQETWIGAWKNLPQLHDTSRLKPWLFGILRNQFYKAINKAKRSPRLEPLAADDFCAGESNSAIDETVQQALIMLAEEQRLPILLVSMEGWSTEEAAQWLGVPKGTLLSRLHRGRQRLKEILTRELELETKLESDLPLE